MDGPENLVTLNLPHDDRPLAGQTILLVEDSRVAAAAIKAFCQKSGARLRRADSLAAAHRHLATYRPTTIVVDLGLPDGSGLEIIRELSGLPSGRPVIVALSGEDASVCRPAALRAGADVFLAKPIPSLAAFQRAILERRGPGDANRGQAAQLSDRQPFRDDLRRAALLMEDAETREDMAYAVQFLASVATTLGDMGLARHATQLRVDLNRTPRGGAAELRPRMRGLAARLRAMASQGPELVPG